MQKFKLRALVVDDYPAGRMVLADQMEFLGYATEMAAHVDAAIELLRRGKFDLVITDWLMPEKTGADLAVAINEIDPGLPIIIVTALDDPMNLSGDPPPGVDAVLSKPVELKTLRQAVESVMAKRIGKEIRNDCPSNAQ